MKNKNVKARPRKHKVGLAKYLEEQETPPTPEPATCCGETPQPEAFNEYAQRVFCETPEQRLLREIDRVKADIAQVKQQQESLCNENVALTHRLQGLVSELTARVRA